jgi:spore coat polysaccharide biosynthesis protein SpsF (cytidylyltransferase family)
MLAIIQARMSSLRLPGKVLMNIAGKPMLERVYDQVLKSNNVKKIIIATSDDSSDDQIEQFCLLQNYPCFRGSLNDVAARFLGVINRQGAEEFIRINGDSPLIDPRLIDIAIAQYRYNLFDLVTNVLHRTFPKGQSVELVRSSTFKRMYESKLSLDDKEHVTKAFYRDEFNFKIKNFSADPPAEDIQLSVDTEEDLNRISAIINACDFQSPGWRDFVRLIPRVST